MGFLCLATYLLGGAQIFPGLLALAACLEGSHEVRVGSPDSEFELVLHHPSRADRQTVCEENQCVHHHGLASRVVCLLASQSDSDPDHVLRLATGAVCEETRQRLDLSPPTSFTGTFAVDGLLWGALPSSLPGSEAHSSFFGATRPSPLLSDHLSALRVTVLLI